MTRFPLFRIGLARLFANLSLVALPLNERGCLDVGFAYVDLLKHRSATIREKMENAAADPCNP